MTSPSPPLSSSPSLNRAGTACEPYAGPGTAGVLPEPYAGPGSAGVLSALRFELDSLRAESDALRAEFGVLSDRVAVADLIDRYITLLDIQDDHGFDPTWPATVLTPDCRLEFPVGTVEGREQAAAFHHDRKSRFARTHHLAANYGIHLDGDTARVRVHLIASHVHHEDGPDPDGRFDIGGYSEGEAVRTPDGWRLHRWRFHLMWSDGVGPRPGPRELRSSQPRPRQTKGR